MSGLVLALDTASRQVSVAVGDAEAVRATRGGAQRGSSAHLLSWIEECLHESGVRLDELAGAVALGGPGSFTGLRVGLATLLGFHQAIGIAATALPTLGVLAAAARSLAEDASAAEGSTAGSRVCAVVPASPGEWFAQPWAAEWPPAPLGEPRRVDAEALLASMREAHATCLVAGSDEEAAMLPAGAAVCVTGPLAPIAARLAARHPPRWDADLLRAPLYLAPAPVTVPGAPKRVMPAGEER